MPDPEFELVDARFQHFYDDQYASAVRLVRMLTGDSDIADDLAQDAFLRVYRYAQGANAPIENPAAFLRTTVTNLCRSWHRTQRSSQLRMVRHGAVDDTLTDSERELDHTLRRLPHDQRAVIVLRYWLGLSEAEIATSLDCRPGTVKSRHARAIRTLRKELS